MDVLMPKPGRYVVAVSGGVDSMALLDMLSKKDGLELLVAHFDHGIRPDSAEDRKLVEAVAGTLSVPCVCLEGSLHAKASEAEARDARYRFLRTVLKKHNADAIITAHHQDDVIETMILNMLRGTGRKGITSLKSRPQLIRPLLNVTKAELIDYARNNNLAWREDSTNEDTRYLRNYVRHNIMPKLDSRGRSKILEIINKLTETNQEIDTLLVKHLAQNLDRKLVIHAPHSVASEVVAEWLRQNNVRDFDRRNIEKLVVAAKTGKPGKKFPVLNGVYMTVNRDDLALTGSER